MNDRFRFRIPITNKDRNFEKFVYFDLFNQPAITCRASDIFQNTEQCTGLKDKNGRLIYEGDILDFDLSIPKNGGHYRGIVYWQNQNNIIGWMISSLKHTWSWDIRQIAHPNDWMTWAEIIGNIHENPEPLEDK